MEKITIEKQDAFRVKIGTKDFGIFHVESKWEGFKKLKNPNGVIIIISHSLGDNHIADIFPQFGEYRIIKASAEINKEFGKEDEIKP